MTGRSSQLASPACSEAHEDRPLAADSVPHEVESREGAPPGVRARDTRRLGLTAIERLAATAILDEKDEQTLSEIQELVRATAEALAGDERDAARVRLLAREIAIQKSALDLFTTQVGIRLQAGDARGALIADRLATSAGRRLALLVAEHRASCAFEKRAIIAITNAAVVHVDGTR